MIFSLFVASQLLVPLSDPVSWSRPDFDGRKSNVVVQDAEGLQIRVEGSSSPLFFKLPETVEVSCLSVDGAVTGFPRLGDQKEGVKGGDDFAFRLGLVSPGDRPGWLKRLFLPKWIRALLEVDPNQGFSEVHFLNISQRIPAGEKREHPELKNVYEEMALQMKASGNFSFKKDFSPPLTAFALWLQSDGDDTESTYTVKIKRLLLCTNPSDNK